MAADLVAIGAGIVAARFDMRDLGAVLDHEEPLPPSGM
jgi:hypothetical protein